MNKPRWAIATCVADPAVYRDVLLASVNRCRGDHPIEILPVWNLEGRYSAALALNLALETAKADMVICVHQDVELLGDWFTNLAAATAELPPNWGVLGAAGIAAHCGRPDIGMWGGSLRGDTVAVGTVHAAADQPPYWNGQSDLTPIHAPDECLFVVNRRTGVQFDLAFTGYHFYGVDLCLQVRAAGLFVYGASLPLAHGSRYSGSLTADGAYWRQLRLLHSKWSNRFPTLLGTHFHWATGELTSYIQYGVDSDSGLSVDVRSAGIVEAATSDDERYGIVTDPVRP